MNKLSELSKPVAWTDERGNLCTNRNKERGLESRYHQDYEKYTTPFYSQEYVSALLAGLEASNKREDGYREKWVAELSNLQDAGKRIAELEAQVKVWESAATKHLERAEEAGKRLATPVRLPALLAAPSEYASRILWAERDTHNATVIKCADAIRAAGFTVEGDE